jgi:hypothetical protein
MTLNVCIGWDSKEPAAAAVLAHSILTRAEKPVRIMPLTRKSISHVYTRPRGPLESTEFSMTRFLVPYLSAYKGWSLFLDCDMLCRTNIWDVMLYPLADPGKAVYVAQHPEYTPATATKFLGQPQTSYPRKNWSSVMLFDNARCQALTPDYVNTATGLDLHRFNWLVDAFAEQDAVNTAPDADSLQDVLMGLSAEHIGSLPLEWNHLVGHYPHNDSAKILHYTDGTPCLPGYEDCDHADLWHAERADMLGEVVELEDDECNLTEGQWCDMHDCIHRP